MDRVWMDRQGQKNLGCEQKMALAFHPHQQNNNKEKN